MREDTFRVQQVITYVVTHSYSDNDKCTAGCETIGQFSSLEQATRFAEMLMMGTPGAKLITLVLRRSAEAGMQDPPFPA